MPNQRPPGHASPAPAPPGCHRGRDGAPTPVVIVGAGLCGAYLAWRLRRAAPAVPVVVLEQSGEPGGRMLSQRMEGMEGVVDLGAGRFNRDDHPTLAALVESLQLPVEPIAARAAGAPAATDPDGAALLRKVFDGSDARRWRDTPFLELCVARLSLDELDRLLSSRGYDVLLDPALPASEAARILAEHPETTGKQAPWLRLRDGFQGLVRRVHERAAEAGATFRFGARVSAVLARDGDAEVRCDDGSVHRAARVVLTAPPCELEGLDLPLSAARRRAIASVRPVPLMKAAFGFERPFWRDHGVADDTYVQVPNPLRKVYFRGRQLLVYNDSASATYWRPLCDPRAVRAGLLWRSVARMLRGALGVADDAPLPEPTHHLGRFWSAGVYTWALGADPEAVQRLLLAPAERVHVCSEAFSPRSGWGEAALDAASLLLNQLDAGRVEVTA